jgi:hypothetical protein
MSWHFDDNTKAHGGVDLNMEDISKSASRTVKEFRKVIPEVLYEEFFRKRYVVPASHHDPRVYNVMECATCLAAGHTVEMDGGERLFQSSRNGIDDITGDDGTGGFNSGVIKSVHRELGRMNYPTFFLDEQLGEMLKKTNIAKGMPLEEIPFPLSGFLISLPKGFWPTRDGEVCQIAIAKTYEYQKHDGTWQFFEKVNDALTRSNKSWAEQRIEVSRSLNPTKGEIHPVFTVVASFNHAEASVGKYPIDGSSMTEMLTDMKNDFYLDETLIEKYKESGVYAERPEQEVSELVKGDVDEMSEIVKFAFKIICFMSAKGDEWEVSTTPIKEARYRRGQLKNEAKWGANFLGRSYGAALREAGYGEEGERKGRIQRYHWRQGYIRGQWYGKGRTKYKTVIIDPYPVNKPD